MEAGPDGAGLEDDSPPPLPLQLLLPLPCRCSVAEGEGGATLIEGGATLIEGGGTAALMSRPMSTGGACRVPSSVV